MRKTILALSIGLVGMVIAVSAGRGNWTCLGETVNTAKVCEGSSECLAEMFPGSQPQDDVKDKPEMSKKIRENAMCLEVCAWKKQGLLNADGSYDKAGAEEMLKAAFPEKVQAGLIKRHHKCAADNNKALSTEEKCESYRPFKECQAMVFSEVCK